MINSLEPLENSFFGSCRIKKNEKKKVCEDRNSA